MPIRSIDQIASTFDAFGFDGQVATKLAGHWWNGSRSQNDSSNPEIDFEFFPSWDLETADHHGTPILRALQPDGEPQKLAQMHDLRAEHRPTWLAEATAPSGYLLTIDAFARPERVGHTISHASVLLTVTGSDRQAAESLLKAAAAQVRSSLSDQHHPTYEIEVRVVPAETSNLPQSREIRLELLDPNRALLTIRVGRNSEVDVREMLGIRGTVNLGMALTSFVKALHHRATLEATKSQVLSRTSELSGLADALRGGGSVHRAYLDTLESVEDYLLDADRMKGSADANLKSFSMQTSKALELSGFHAHPSLELAALTIENSVEILCRQMQAAVRPFQAKYDRVVSSVHARMSRAVTLSNVVLAAIALLVASRTVTDWDFQVAILLSSTVVALAILWIDRDVPYLLFHALALAVPLVLITFRTFSGRWYVEAALVVTLVAASAALLSYFNAFQLGRNSGSRWFFPLRAMRRLLFCELQNSTTRVGEKDSEL